MLLTSRQVQEALLHDPLLHNLYAATMNLLRERQVTPSELRAVVHEACVQYEMTRTDIRWGFDAPPPPRMAKPTDPPSED